MSSPPFLSAPSAVSSSSRRHHLVITPAGHTSPPLAPLLLVDERGGTTGRLRSILMSLPCCLLAQCRCLAFDEGRPLASPAPCAFIPYPMRLSSACLVGSLPAPLLVPSGVPFVHRLPLRLPPLLLACFHGSSSSWLLSYRLPSRFSPLFAPSPRRLCRETGRRHRLAYRHAVRRERVRAASLPVSCGFSLLAWRGVAIV